MRDKTDSFGININGSMTINGPMFDIHDNEQVTILTQQNSESIDDETLIVKLTPICKKNRESAKEFLRLVRGERAARITELVNDWVKDGLIEKEDRHRNLWFVLHEAGIYDKIESTWNQQVK